MSRLEHKLDWSKHELLIEQEGDITIFKLKIPDTCMQQVNFVNILGRLLVTGDYGDWVFDRTFYPQPGATVSDSYWLEKLKISMRHTKFELDWEAIEEALEGFIMKLEGEGVDITEEIEEWVDGMKRATADRFEPEFLMAAYGNIPGNMDADDVPCYREVPVWLDIVFEAFEEICRRMEVQEGVNTD